MLLIRRVLLVSLLPLLASIPLHVPSASRAQQSTSLAWSQSAATSPTRPNIVLITTDDQRLDEMKALPRTRRLLGGRGMTFTNMLSPHPLCCPARAEILSGQFAQNNGVLTNDGPYGGYSALRDPDDTLPTWLGAAGYRTAMIGKFMNQWRPHEHGEPPGWTQFLGSPLDSLGYYDFTIYEEGVARRYNDGEAYSSNYVTDATVAAVDRWSHDDGARRPFFIWSSYYAPHGDCARKENGCKVPPTPEHRYAKDFASSMSPTLRHLGWRAEPHRPNPMVAGRERVSRSKVQRLHKMRLRSLRSVDNGVSTIVEALRRNDVLENTLIVFTSDNGYLTGEHRFTGKVVPYEEALRVPLLVRGPGVARGSTTSSLATTVDLAPTISAAAGAVPGRRVDGRDLAAQLRGAPGPPEPTILIQAGTPSHKVDRLGPWLYRGVRTSRWTFSTWQTSAGNSHVELFDRLRDPHQVRNLSEVDRMRPVVRELRSRLRELRACEGPEACFRDFGEEPTPRRVDR